MAKSIMVHKYFAIIFNMGFLCIDLEEGRNVF